MAFITIDGENLIAQKQGSQQVLNFDEFVLANIAGLGSEPADRIESMPAGGDIVWQGAITKLGYVNDNQVVASVTLDSTIGDFDFNWVGVKEVGGTLIAVEYLGAPVSKIATNGGVPGNNLVRNFLIAYSGIQATTAIGVPASTWQIDFTTRLLEIDERERLSNFDIYGQGTFFGDAFKVAFVSGTTFSVDAGVAYVGGIRLDRQPAGNITATPWPTSIWVDASLQGDINGVQPVYSFVVSAAAQPDYTDGNGFNHYLTKIADIDAAGNVTDTRTLAGLPFATKTQRGIIELATTAETIAGIDDERAVTPADLAAFMNSLASPLGALDYPTVDTADNRLTVTPASATNGGTVSIAGGTLVTLGQEIVAGVSGRMATFSTPAFTSSDLAINSTYYLRAFEQGGSLQVYVQQGTDADAVPGSFKGTPGGGTGGGFDSTVLDVLLAKVVTSVAGSVPTVTPLANAKRLAAKTSFSEANGQVTRTIVLHWGRTPRAVVPEVFGLTSAPGIDADQIFQISNKSRYSYNLLASSYDWGSTPNWNQSGWHTHAATVNAIG